MQSWVSVSPESHFSLQNLPYGIFSTAQDPKPRPGVAIGDNILDLKAASKLAPLAKTQAAAAGCFSKENFNHFMSLGKEAWKEVRAAITQLLSADEPLLRDNAALKKEAFISMSTATMHLPAHIGDYTDFYACMEHTKNGTAIRTGLRVTGPNWVHLPVAYHSRSSSVVISGTDVKRPRGQALPPPTQTNFIWRFLSSWQSAFSPQPAAGPSKALDFELEMACFIGPGNKQGEAITTSAASDQVFGLVLMNDWSARDVQRWEMLPLGPFNSKNFATSISPWIVPLEALEPFRREAPPQTPQVLGYLQQPSRQLFDIDLQVSLQPEGGKPTIIGRTNYQQLYWTLEQMIAHHTFGGCNLRPGDLLGTGTISSPGPGGQGSLMELSWNGARPVELEGGQTRSYIQDGDTITLSGYCQGEGYRVGFGECTGSVLPAPPEMQ